MIRISDVHKKYNDVTAIDGVSLDINEGVIFGLLGTNGAGKSTLLRMMSGVIKPDGGVIDIDGEPVWDNPCAKSKCFYVSDDQFYYPNATPSDLARFYKYYYRDFDEPRLRSFLTNFDLGYNRKIRTFSKGMKKQISILFGLCANVPYLFLDETFDGLDPVMRQTIKSLITKEIGSRPFSAVIASHSLREIEDVCDHVGLLHKGGVLLSKDIDDMKLNLTKVQCVLPSEHDEYLRETLDVLKMTRQGNLLTLTVRGDGNEVASVITALNPVYFEALPLSLEEIFISETEVAGYDMQSLIS